MRLSARSFSRVAALAVATALVVPQVGLAPASAAPTVAVPATPAAKTAPVKTAPVKAAAAKKVVRYTKSRVNVRSGPGVKYRVVGAYAKGRKLTGTVTKNGWLRTGAGAHVSPKVLTGKSPAKKSTGTLAGAKVLAQAAKYKGIMYRSGGSTPSGFDCSGYTRYVFAKLGKSLPRTVSGQRAATTRVSSPKPGDLVFWGTYHVAIYAGNGYIWDSGRPGLPIQKRRMFSGVTSYGRVR